MPHPTLRIRIPPVNEQEFAPTNDEPREASHRPPAADVEDEEDYICCRECGDEAPATYWGDFCSRGCYIEWWSDY
jgi:hypothetical protein